MAYRAKNMIKGLIKLGYREGKEFYPDRDGDGLIVLSGECYDGEVLPPCDYWNEFGLYGEPVGIPAIDPRVEALAKRNGGWIEWESAGCAKIYRD